MNDAIPALLAFLLLSSLVAIPVIAADTGDTVADGDARDVTARSLQSDTGGVTDVDGTTNRLELVGDVQNEHTEYGADLGMALTNTDTELRVDFEQYATVDSRFESASNKEREEIVRSGNQRIDRRISALEDREERAVVAHANGDISGTELLQTMLQTYHEAAVLADKLDSLEKRSHRVEGWSLSVENKREALDMYRTPVRARLDAAASDRKLTETVAIQTSETGYRLAILDDGEYVYETTRFDNRGETGSDQFSDVEEAYNYATELYPWTADRKSGLSASEYQTVGLYQTEMSHDQGELNVYLDGRTGNVYREIQELSLPALPTTDERRWSENGLEVTLNETAANGPVELTVSDEVTGRPEAATVAVDGTVIAETGDDGSIWFVPPEGEYELTVETGTTGLETTVRDE